MKLIFEIETDEELSEIEEIHNLLDDVFLGEGIGIKKSSLQSEGELAEITIHDSDRKCRICGCDWFHACPGGCYWVEEDLCSSCASQQHGRKLSLEEVIALPDGTEIYIESVFPHDYDFVGIKEESYILEPSGSQWVLAADFEALCTAYEILEENESEQ